MPHLKIVHCSSVQSSTNRVVHCCAAQHNTLLCSVLQCITLQCSVLQHSKMHLAMCSAGQCNSLHNITVLDSAHYNSNEYFHCPSILMAQLKSKLPKSISDKPLLRLTGQI